MPSPAREVRVHRSLLAGVEQRALVHLAERTPAWINSDHLTALGALAMLGAGACYALAPSWPAGLPLVVVCLVLNWLGDSLDGTLARVRRHERPRYGFYVDHVLDAVGMLSLVAGLAAGGFISVLPAAALLITYYLLTVEIGLATHTLGTFRISYWRFGPTELRILLAIGTLQLVRSPWATIAGHRLLLFDVGASVAATAIFITFVVAAVANTRRLYRLEPLPVPLTEPGAAAGARHPRPV